MTNAADGSGAMFDSIAPGYDRLNRLMSLGMDRGWRRRLVRALELTDDSGEVIDLATGTGDVAQTIITKHPNITVVGVDPSSEMLRVAEGKLDPQKTRWYRGGAENLAFADDRFLGATMAFGLRNIPDRLKALQEMRRVVRPGHVVAVLELTQPRGHMFAALARFHVHHIVPRLGAMLSGPDAYAYLARSIAAFPPPGDIVELMTQAGIREARAEPLAFGSVHLFIGRA